MAKPDNFFLDDILQSIAWIEEDVSGLSFDEFAESRSKRQLVERNLQIISEASRDISPELKATQPQIEWREIAGIGNVLRHDYADVMPTILWNIITENLSEFKSAIIAIKAASNSD